MPRTSQVSISVEAHPSDEHLMRKVTTKVYRRRWFILFMYAYAGFFQCAVWNTWGPITETVKAAFPSWTNGTIAVMSMWGTLTMLLGLIPLTYILMKYGLRISMIITAGLMACGTFVRIFYYKDEEKFTEMAHLGSVLNGFAGVVIGAAPAMISSTWFEPSRRTTATAIGCTFNQLGNAGGFYLGPALVGSAGELPDALRYYINRYMWITFAISAALFILVVFFFEKKPKYPPSISTAKRQERSTKTELKCLFSNLNLLIMAIPYAINIGLNVAWSSVLEINVEDIGMGQNEAALLGIIVTFGGVFTAVFISMLTDRLFGHMKITIIVLQAISFIGYMWFCLLMNRCLPYSKWQLYVSVVIGASASYGTSPIFFELACEIVYPVPEALVGCFLNFAWNIISVSFLVIMQLHFVSGVLWMDYVLVGGEGLALLVMFFVKEEYNRTNVDLLNVNMIKEESEEEDDQEDDNAEVYSERDTLIRPNEHYGAI